MTMTTLQSRDFIGDVSGFIRDTMLVGLSDQSIEPDESLVQRGVIDSTGVLELVTFLQDRYGIEIKDDEITTDNLDSLNAIAAFLRRKLTFS
jgi:acyl carrier protein